MNNSVLTGQFDQNLLQQGLVGQAILPASVSGKDSAGERPARCATMNPCHLPSWKKRDLQ
jgi:hypothetical protein